MDFYISLVEWPKLLSCIHSPSWADDEIEMDFGGIALKDWYDSFTMYMECAEILSWMVGVQEAGEKSDAITALAFLIDPSYCKAHDVDSSLFELGAGSLDPERLAGLWTRLKHLPTPKELEDLFSKLPSTIHRTTRTASFDRFYEYLQQWLDAIKTATDNGLGMLMSVG